MWRGDDAGHEIVRQALPPPPGVLPRLIDTWKRIAYLRPGLTADGRQKKPLSEVARYARGATSTVPPRSDTGRRSSWRALSGPESSTSQSSGATVRKRLHQPEPWVYFHSDDLTESRPGFDGIVMC